MNEDELKKIWQTDQTAPIVNFGQFQNLLKAWNSKLRRKVVVDIGMQIIATVLTVMLVFFLPKMFILALMMVIICIWYVRELRGLYKLDSGGTNYTGVKNLLETKIQTMKNYFRRTRIVMYIIMPLVIPAAFYGIEMFDKLSANFTDSAYLLIEFFLIFEILVFIATEIYFKILYTPALDELKNLLRQLNTEE